jgi:glycogen phosphorylase
MAKTTSTKKDAAKQNLADQSGISLRVSETTKEAFMESFNLHLHKSLARDRYTATQYDKFLAIAYAVRDRLIDRWIRTQQTYYKKDVKRIYYLSLEFLIGRTLGNGIINLDVESEITEALDSLGLSLEELRDAEVDAGLGNGGLGRLAACFIDSMATLELPAMGMGIRYEYGMFHQSFENGFQKENPDNWLKLPNPWEIARPENQISIQFNGDVYNYTDEKGKTRVRWESKDVVIALPYDTPVPGYKNNTVNNLRLWSARSADEFGLDYFNNGDYLSAIKDMEITESISKVLYPNDKSMNGKELRLKQQYFLCSASLQDIIRRYKKTHDDFKGFADHNAIQLNDTHPAISIPEMMRILVDEEGMSWDEAWKITVSVFAYTNHTLMPEALEKWPVQMFEKMLPRHMQIIYEINYRWLRQVAMKWPGDMQRLSRMSIIEENPEKCVRMAFLSIVGSHKVNGVAHLHSELLKSHLFKDFYEFCPEKFTNMTNGVTQRRWVKKSNPLLSELISSKIGDGWVKNLSELTKLEPFAKDKEFQKQWQEIKKTNKKRLAEYILEHNGIEVDPNSIFDVQIKRIHEYKRQLMLALYIVHQYDQIKNHNLQCVPRTFIFGGKAAPGYYMAKQIIKLINSIADVVNNDPSLHGKLKVVFLENYRVSVAEKIFPASDLSEQISTAGTEASGTGNMKFALNGALTMGTLDGANVEMLEEVGEENIIIFGLKVDEVMELKASGYKPWDYYQKSKGLQAAMDLISSGFFSPETPQLFKSIIESLMNNDQYLLLADFDSYIEAQKKVDVWYRDQSLWTQKAILNVARMGKFSSDRTIAQYNEEIWKSKPISISLED